MGIENRRLHARDVDRKIDLRPRTRFHAEFVRTNEAAGLPHGIIGHDVRDGVIPVFLKGSLNEVSCVTIDGTGFHARLGFAVETTPELSFELRPVEIEMFVVHRVLFSPFTVGNLKIPI